MKQPQNIKEQHHQYKSVKQLMTLESSPKIKGFDFEKAQKEGFNLKEFLQAYSTTGFQATNLAEGIEITKIMQREKATIFLSFTSNMISSGVREAIAYLAKHKKAQVLVTSAGGIEEDIIKCLKPFALGQFNLPGNFLFENGINRIGNILVPNDRYAYFDKFMQEFFTEVYEEQKKNNQIFAPHELIKKLGEKINQPDSYLYWAAKNNIPVFCPGLIDGSLGDLIYFFKQSHPDFVIDITKEMKTIVDLVLNSEKTAAICLGSGISKHFTLNANIFKEGLDYAVYINTGEEFDGSDSGARVEETISWGKIKAKAPAVKIHCDATIAFPLMVIGGFVE